MAAITQKRPINVDSSKMTDHRIIRWLKIFVSWFSNENDVRRTKVAYYQLDGYNHSNIRMTELKRLNKSKSIGRRNL